MRSLAAIFVLCAIAFAGCETTRGLGQDMENTGENIQQGVRSTTDKRVYDDGNANAQQNRTRTQQGNQTGMGAGMENETGMDNQSGM